MMINCRRRLTAAEMEAIDTVITAVVVTGCGIGGIYQRKGALGLVRGYLSSPRACRAEIRTFLSEASLDEYMEKYRHYVSRMSSQDEVMVLIGNDALLFLGFLHQVGLFDEEYSVGGDGHVHSNMLYGDPIRNSNLYHVSCGGDNIGCDDSRDNGNPWDLETTDVIVTSCDALEMVNGREHLYYHTSVSRGIKYVLDMTTLLYWPIRSLPPGICDSQLPYAKVSKMSRESVGYLMAHEGLNADIILNCEIAWGRDLEMIEVCRQEIDGTGRTRRRYNYFTPKSGYISKMWFDGVSKATPESSFERYAFISAHNGRQWFRVTFGGRVEKWRFEAKKI